MSARRQATSHAAWTVCALALTWPWSCYADYGNMLNFTRRDTFEFAALLALPTAAVCVLIEAIAPRRRVPYWLSVPSGFAAAAAMYLALFADVHKVGGEFVLAWFIVPPLATLALRGFLIDPLPRFLAGWVVALAAFALGTWIKPDQDNPAVLAGGAASCLLLWSSVVLVLVARGTAPQPKPGRSQRSELRSSAVAATRRAHDVARPLLNRIEQVLRPAETGLSWWLGAVVVLYFGIGAAVAHGSLGGGGWIYVEVQGIIDLFGLPPLRIAQSKQLWWLVGLPWSLVAGSAAWGLAGLVGVFNPGRARLARLAAIVFGGALLVWSAMLVVQTGEIRAREEQAAGIRR